ncbi:MAG: hypothetical protein V9E94_04580 [Microthrixaceae bacterium]
MATELDLAALRGCTPGCTSRVHLNDAGAALPTSATLERGGSDTFALEAEMGGYEAAAVLRAPELAACLDNGGKSARRRCRRGIAHDE